MTDPAPRSYTGHLERLPDGTYGGELRDDFGWPIHLTATVVERDGRRLFELSGTLGPTPSGLWIEMLDGEKKAE